MGTDAASSSQSYHRQQTATVEMGSNTDLDFDALKTDFGAFVSQRLMLAAEEICNEAEKTVLVEDDARADFVKDEAMQQDSPQKNTTGQITQTAVRSGGLKPKNN